MFDWLQNLVGGNRQDPASAAGHPKQRPGTITRTFKKCGARFTLPEEVQHWPDYCQECRVKYRPVEMITRTCRGCGRSFQFESSVWHWPRYCRDCQQKRKR